MTASAPGVGSAENPILRTAARILLIDDAGRLLLMRGFNPADPDVRYWFTVGGGIDPGEGVLEGAVRELREETGLSVSPRHLDGPMRRDVVTFPYDGRWYRQDQEFFVCRVPSWEVSTEGFDVEERRAVDAHRWWTVEELATTDETIYPVDLAATLRAILEG